jgi:hypothetical protein
LQNANPAQSFDGQGIAMPSLQFLSNLKLPSFWPNRWVSDRVFTFKFMVTDHLGKKYVTVRPPCHDTLAIASLFTRIIMTT